MIDRDIAYIAHILESITFIEDFSHSILSASSLNDHPLERAGIERMLTIIGEAAKNISPELRSQYPQVPWKEIAGMRDKIMHHYFGIDYEAVYETIIRDIPELKIMIVTIIKDYGFAEDTRPENQKLNRKNDDSA